jgi:hypothetical protein
MYFRTFPYFFAGDSPGWLGNLNSDDWQFSFQSNGDPDEAESGRRATYIGSNGYSQPRPVIFVVQDTVGGCIKSHINLVLFAWKMRISALNQVV